MQKLTDAQAKTLPIGDYQDSAQPALRLVVTATTRSWSLYKWSKARNKPVRRKLGNVANLSVTEARKRATELALALDDGADLREQAPKAITFDFICKEYTLKLKRDERKAAGWCEYVFDLSFKDWREKHLGGITRADIDARLGKVTDERGKHAAATAGRAIRALYNFAEKRELYEGRNLGRFLDLAESKPRRQVLKDGEEAKVMEVLEAWEANGLQSWARPFFKLLLATGVRWGNLVAARWEEIDLDEAAWTIPGQKFKNGDPMRVLLSDAAVSILKDQRKAHPASPWVFPSPQKNSEGHLVEPTWQWKKIKALCGLTGARHITPHDLRRTFGSKQISKGTSLSIVARMLGHKSVSTTEQHYAHVDDAAVRAALAA